MNRLEKSTYLALTLEGSLTASLEVQTPSLLAMVMTTLRTGMKAEISLKLLLLTT